MMKDGVKLDIVSEWLPGIVIILIPDIWVARKLSH